MFLSLSALFVWFVGSVSLSVMVCDLVVVFVCVLVIYVFMMSRGGRVDLSVVMLKCLRSVLVSFVDDGKVVCSESDRDLLGVLL